MNVQNISGPDVITTTINVNSEISQKPNDEETRRTNTSEENKGQKIDTYT